MLCGRGCADAGARSIGDYARSAAGERAVGQSGARCRTDRADCAAGRSDLQRHVAGLGRIDVDRRFVHVLAPQPCTDVELKMPSNIATTTTTLGKYLDGLPAWARELSEKYYSRSFALFVLYGNVRDLVPLRGQETTSLLTAQRDQVA